MNELLEAIDLFVKLATLDYVKVFGPYARSNDPKDKRKIVIVQDSKGNKRTVSYPKFLMEQHLGKQLDINDTVDHINNDIDDNRLENLRVLPRAEHSALDTKRVKPVKLKCSECGNEFERTPRRVRDKARKGAPGFCSRVCAGKYARKLQLGLIDKLPGQPMVESVYYRKKHLAELADRLMTKYAGLISD